MKTKSNTTRKLALAGILTAVAVVGSLISVPVRAVNAPRSSTWSMSSRPWS